MAERNIILVLTSDPKSLETANRVAKHLPNSVIKVFTPFCLDNLSPEDVKQITVISNIPLNGLEPKQFVQDFHMAMTRNGLKKSAVEGMRWISSAQGMVDENGNSEAQKIANEFALHGYQLHFKAFTNRHMKNYGNYSIAIGPQGEAKIYGYLNSGTAEKAKDLLQAKGLPVKSKQLEYDKIKMEYMKLRAEVESHKNPINALDNDKKYLFLPSLPKEYLIQRKNEVEASLAEELEYIRGQPDGLYEITEKQRLLDLLSTINGYLTNDMAFTQAFAQEPPLTEKVSTKIQQPENTVFAWFKSVWQGIQQLIVNGGIKSISEDEIHPAPAQTNSQDSNSSSFAQAITLLGNGEGEVKSQKISGKHKPDGVTGNDKGVNVPEENPLPLKKQLAELKQKTDDKQVTFQNHL